jgi:hypothetical protein
LLIGVIFRSFSSIVLVFFGIIIIGLGLLCRLDRIVFGFALLGGRLGC